MKIKISHLKSQIGSILLYAVVLVITIVIFSIVVTKLTTVYKRVDDKLDTRFIDQNATNTLLNLPSGTYPWSIHIQSSLASVVTWDGPDEPPIAAVASAGYSRPASWHLEVCLERYGGIRLALRNTADSGWRPTALGSLVPLDEYGIPTATSSGPALAGVSVTLQVKTNLTSGEWQTVMPLVLQPNTPAYHSVALDGPAKFFRVVRQ